MTELTIRKIDQKKVIHEVAYNLDKISKLYGYKIPGPTEAKDLTQFVIKNFQYLRPSEIQTAFEMVSMQKLAVDIEAYGRILIIPILTKVLKAYQVHRNKSLQNANSTSRELKGEALIAANKKASLFLLNQLEDENTKIRIIHYQIIDELVERFPSQLKVDVFQEEVQKENARLKGIKPVSRGESISIRNLLNNNEGIKVTAIINAQVRLAKEYIKDSIIDYESARRRIENNEVLDRID